MPVQIHPQMAEWTIYLQRLPVEKPSWPLPSPMQEKTGSLTSDKIMKHKATLTSALFSVVDPPLPPAEE